MPKSKMVAMSSVDKNLMHGNCATSNFKPQNNAVESLKKPQGTMENDRLLHSFVLASLEHWTELLWLTEGFLEKITIWIYIYSTYWFIWIKFFYFTLYVLWLQDSRFNKEIDKQTGYKTRSILCMPVKDHDDEVGEFSEHKLQTLESGHFSSNNCPICRFLFMSRIIHCQWPGPPRTRK